jgi:hypothetical protein
LTNKKDTDIYILEASFVEYVNMDENGKNRMADLGITIAGMNG